MRPFNREKKVDVFEASRRRKLELSREAIEKLKEFRQLGEKFTYLGVTVVVTGHSKAIIGGYSPDYLMPRLGREPTLMGDYVNALGEIKKISFAYEELPTLKAENGE